jgi:hypothetical protein
VDRGRTVQAHLRPIYNDYRSLERMARDARYQCMAFTAQDIRTARERLDRVRERVLQELQPPSRNRNT